jgi:hypothetical protein
MTQHNNIWKTIFCSIYAIVILPFNKILQYIISWYSCRIMDCWVLLSMMLLETLGDAIFFM